MFCCYYMLLGYYILIYFIIEIIFFPLFFFVQFVLWKSKNTKINVFKNYIFKIT